MKPLRLTQPYAIILVGLPGSGKTHFGEKFAETFSAPFINSNIIDAHSRSVEDTNILTDYLVDEMTRTSQTFIVEGDTSSRIKRTELARSLRQKGYQPLVVWLQTDEPTANSRSRKQISEDEYVRRQRNFSPPHSTEHALVLSGKHTYASQAKVVLNYLAKHGGRSEAPIETPERPALKPVSQSSSSSRSISIQ
jgi:shikimate kinase